jgi:tRNA(fMet)-specific endonuclease VapC
MGILISGERLGQTPQQLFQYLRRTYGEIAISISVISIVELDHGIFRAQSPKQADSRRKFSSDICRIASVQSITVDIARLAGQIEGEQAARGFAIPLADLLIGCTALFLGDSVLTGNPKHFTLIPNLPVLTL